MINDKTMIKAIMMAWAEYGLFVDRTSYENNTPTMYVSVPEHSEYIDSDGKELSGMFLAARLKSTVTDIGANDFTMKARIRKDEYWTKIKGEQAKNQMCDYVKRY